MDSIIIHVEKISAPHNIACVGPHCAPLPDKRCLKSLINLPARQEQMDHGKLRPVIQMHADIIDKSHFLSHADDLNERQVRFRTRTDLRPDRCEPFRIRIRGIVHDCHKFRTRSEHNIHSIGFPRTFPIRKIKPERMSGLHPIFDSIGTDSSIFSRKEVIHRSAAPGPDPGNLRGSYSFRTHFTGELLGYFQRTVYCSDPA